MQFNDLLRSGNVDPKGVIVFRHRPKEPRLRKVLPWLVEENPTLFNAYQQTQGPIVEKAMLRAKFVASFFGHEPGQAVFVGLYENKGHQRLSFHDYWKKRANVELRDKYGMVWMADKQSTILWFDLAPLAFHKDWKGKLTVGWPGKDRSWWRWADRNAFPIVSIVEDSYFDRKMPEWNQLALSWNELHVLPRRWREELSRWRGIYYILDEQDGKGYVGAAFGADNLFGRWLTYAKSGHGGNKKLRGRDPKGFRFSVLQLLPHDMPKEEVEAIERTWKDRLHTREFGLNNN
jgi:hypothetical protein